jgi:hypothetical protein
LRPTAGEQFFFNVFPGMKSGFSFCHRHTLSMIVNNFDYHTDLPVRLVCKAGNEAKLIIYPP